MAAVEVIQLKRSFGGTLAVDGATWSAAAGQVTCILGPNGAGKTTTIECLEGLQRPDGGQVRVLGADPLTAGPDHRAQVGVMLQDGGLPQSVPALRLLRHLATLVVPPAGHEDALDRLIAQLDITAFGSTPVRRLSGGQRQRVALAAALLNSPQVAFLDEPSAGLDPHARRDVWRIVTAQAERGAAVVVTTHSFEEAERIGDRVVIMHRGRVVANAPTTELTSGSSLEEVFFSLTVGDQ